ncbi:MAG: cobalamin-binding protein [Ignavibacteria bacterium]
MRYPSRIVCLTEETTETLYLLGCGDMVVGISGFTVRPPEARTTKPKVSTFTEADYDAIVALEPDLVLTFSDLQAEITKELMLRGIQVVGFNQRSVEEILRSMLIVGSLVGKSAEAETLVERMAQGLERIRERAYAFPFRPKVYFEEWDSPMISCIRWVSELVEIAGAEDIFIELRARHSARERVVEAEEVIRRNPHVIIGSWCGKRFRPELVRARVGWDRIEAVRRNRVFEIKSSIILQPGPAALTDGVQHLSQILERSLG